MLLNHGNSVAPERQPIGEGGLRSSFELGFRQHRSLLLFLFAVSPSRRKYSRLEQKHTSWEYLLNRLGNDPASAGAAVKRLIADYSGAPYGTTWHTLLVEAANTHAPMEIAGSFSQDHKSAPRLLLKSWVCSVSGQLREEIDFATGGEAEEEEGEEAHTTEEEEEEEEEEEVHTTHDGCLSMCRQSSGKFKMWGNVAGERLLFPRDWRVRHAIAGLMSGEKGN
jgi:hypothetical protein